VALTSTTASEPLGSQRHDTSSAPFRSAYMAARSSGVCPPDGAAIS
jgi:hypothetical protein